jgi:hypothetical protein
MMSDIPESGDSFPPAIPLISETDLVQGGGREAIDNRPHALLADRTAFLKAALEIVEAELAELIPAVNSINGANIEPSSIPLNRVSGEEDSLDIATTYSSPPITLHFGASPDHTWPYDLGLCLTSNHRSAAGLGSFNLADGYAMYAASSATGRYGDYAFVAFRSENPLSPDNTDLVAAYLGSSKQAAVFSNLIHNTSAEAAGQGYGLKVNGAILPFTGSHEALYPKGDPQPEMGDIVVDGDTVVRRDVSDTIADAHLSSEPLMKYAVGIFALQVVDVAPVCLSETVTAYREEQVKDDEGDDVVRQVPYQTSRVRAEYQHLVEENHVILVNSVGEGQVNVCGENGNIEKGDLIVTSSMPGKGMKQDDDILRTSSVARARESVTFTSPGEVKMVACIYLCG